MVRFLFSRTIAVLCLAIACLGLAGAADGEKSNTREFQFTYSCTVKDLKPGQPVRIWVPVPSTSEVQTVSLVERRTPGRAQVNREPKYGNEILFVEGNADQSGTAIVTATYRVRRSEVTRDLAARGEIEKFLRADGKVPVGGKAMTLIAGKDLPTEETAKAHMLYDTVFGHMRYSKEGSGWGQGDSDWACDSKYGNCTDFHSLFISLARAQKIPAKFEIGFSIPDKRGEGEIAGYHCWAYFKPQGKGWVPVDISEASKNPKMKDYYFGNLTADRVTFSTGRDLILAPAQQGPPLNFFIYPYVEVDGKPYPAEKVARKFSYQDVK